LREYFRKFEDCLAKTDVLWTKPSELTFYAALGIPMLLAPPIGGQEHANRDWLLSNNAALDAGDPSMLDNRLENLLEAGELCRVAWNAYSRLDRNGLGRIQKVINSIGPRIQADHPG
jgi:UDP-N-acetylglucosamine:LPS N-acetylglucosamine transferase